VSAELLVRRFAQVTETPNAIARLRRFLIDLAVSGRLGDDRDKPIRIGWPYAPLGDLVDLRYGKGLAQADRTPEGPVAVYGSNGIVARTHTALADAPSIIVGRKGSAGALRIADEPSWPTDVAYYIEPPPSLDIRFLFFALQSLRLESLGKGVKPGLSRSDAYPLLLPQPPLTDQRRIVARVDALMALCDELEAAQTHREARRDRVRATSLRNLVAPEEPKENARFFLRHSARMITSPEHVAGVRQAIWDLAVRGRLVPQDSADGAAKDLLGQILRLKSRTTSSRPRANSELTASNSSAACQLPESWTWAQWQDVTLRIGDLDHAMPEAVATEGYPYVSPRDFRPNNVIDFDGAKRISASDYLRLSAKIRPERGDLIYPRYGTIGETRLVSTDREFLASYSCAVIKISDELTDSRYQYTFSRSDIGQVQAAAAVNQGTQPNVGIMSIKAFRFPLPPLAEQRRIVAKVDELMALCNELEQSLAAEQTKRARLLEALLHDVLEDPLSARGREPLGSR